MPGRVLVLLAAGRGSRFGGGKLAADLGGKPLARHAADRLLALPFASHIALCSPDTPDLPGYHRIMLDPPGAPLSCSIALGTKAAADAGASGVMIALADMPLVPADHYRALMAAFDGDRIATRADGVAMPPAVFGARHFAALIALEGDRGAGVLLRDAPFVALPMELALDVDTAGDLARAEGLLQAR